MVIDDFFYRVKSLIECIGTCFKSFAALNADYPVQCKDVWTLIEREVYKIGKEKVASSSDKLAALSIELNIVSDTDSVSRTQQRTSGKKRKNGRVSKTKPKRIENN